MERLCVGLKLEEQKTTLKQEWRFCDAKNAQSPFVAQYLL